jgi:serine/threonine-protein kinase
MDRQSDPSSVETVAVVSPSSSSFADEGRFVPGTLLGGRYRIIALLGRGGMGEVYRATDLTLGQSVALKFLPADAARDQRLLERFHGEVRVARQVSHPNVCRVYDIGEVEGMPFISMEYVDGEDLASLLTRIGRLPSDKALETARKICAGLAAAHDRGVIHRDLKPQNIMMNKRGEVVIMDFGLAAIADHLAGAEVRNGTPAYMAPEQLKGAEVTSRSDLYALGLVLYELFTGKRPFEAKTVRQMIDLQEAAQLTSMSSIAADVDPAVEKAIRRCLDPDPAKRPGNALAVSMALPGGDPLAAALAAGETPSPELVAAAGETQGLPRKYSIPCLAVIVLCVFGATIVRQKTDATMHAPLDLAPDALAAKAREIAVSLGYPKKPADTSLGLDGRTSYVSYLSKLPEPRKWDDWLAAEAPVGVDYREGPAPLVARPDGEVTRANPPPIFPGMVYVRLDGFGRLLEFSGVPYRVDEALAEPVQAQTVFRAAGFDLANFTETPPQELPSSAADQVRAWKGPHPKIPNTELRVELASWKGRITRFRIVPPWAPLPAGTPPATSWAAKLRDVYPIVLMGVGALIAALFARRNWKLERADRKGAMRVAIARFLMSFVGWGGAVHAVPTDDMVDLFSRAASDWLLSAAMLWLVYLALEPAVRSRWPHSIVTWNRLLAGRWQDPQVASHVLIGAAAGAALWFVFGLFDIWALAHKNALEVNSRLFFALGTREWLGGHAFILANAFRFGLFFFFGVFALRVLLRKDLLAAIAAAILFMLMEGGLVYSPDWQVKAFIYAVVYAAIFFILLRCGLIASIVAICYINGCGAIMLGADWKAWYAPYGLASILLLLSIAGVAFWKSLGARGLIGNEAAET